MFLGTTWPDLQKMLAETVRTWGDVPCGVACCGNFTLDRVLHACGVPAIRSCDVSLYTSALGAVLSGQPLPVTLRPEYAERWPWLALGMDNQTRIAATMMLITQIAYALDKPDNPHYARLLRGYSDQWGALLDDVQIASLSEASLKFSTLALVFLPDEIEHLNDLMERATKDAPADHYWLVSFRDYDRALDGIEAASRAYNIKNTAAAFSIVMDIFEQHVADLRSGYEHASGSRSVPTVAAFGAVALPAALAQKLQQRLQALDKDPITALTKLLEDT